VYRVGVGDSGQPDTPGAFERRGAIRSLLFVCAFYGVNYAVYLTGWVPGS